MKDKLMIMALAVALLIGLCSVRSAYANTTEVVADDTKYCDLNEYMQALGKNMPTFDLKEGCNYIFYKDNNYYYVLEIYNLKITSDTAPYLQDNNYYIVSDCSVTVKQYRITCHSADCSGLQWDNNNTNTNTIYIMGGYSDYPILYSDFNVYSSSFSSVVVKNNKIIEKPSIPSALKEGAETVVMARFSPMAKAYAGQYCLMVSSAPEVVLRTSDRAIVFVEDGAYVGDVEIWFVGESGEFELAYSNKVGYCGNDLVGYGLEYAPKVVYTNKPVYLQDDSASVIMASSELYCDVSEDAYITPIVTPTPTPSTPSGGTGSVGGLNIVTYTSKIKAEVKADSVNMRDYPSLEGNAIASFIKTWGVDILGYVYDADGATWYYCKTVRDNMEYIGFIKAEYLKILSVENNDFGLGDFDFGDIDLEDAPELIKTAKDSFVELLGFVGVVPMMIGAVFGFLPSWCLGLVCCTIVVICFVAIMKRG